MIVKGRRLRNTEDLGAYIQGLKADLLIFDMQQGTLKGGNLVKGQAQSSDCPTPDPHLSTAF